jgi:hypothetical protein
MLIGPNFEADGVGGIIMPPDAITPAKVWRKSDVY